MHELTNVTITRCEKGPSGTSAYGVWQIHNVWINNNDQKYSYFEKDGYIPVVGTMLASMNFDVEQKGQYTNYTIKEMVAVPAAPPVVAAVPAAVPAVAVRPAPVAQPMPTAVAQPVSVPVVPAVQPVLVAQPVQSVPVVKPEPVPSRELMMCVAYVKDILIQEIVVGHIPPNDTFEALVSLVGEAGVALFNQLKAGKPMTEVAKAVSPPVPTVNEQPVNSNPAPPVLADKDMPF